MTVQQNRPLNSQNVADALQKFNLKKTAVQKALDALADSGQISFKEYGKQKIYLARQDQFDIPNGEELEEMKKANAKLQEELADQKKAISEVESGKFQTSKLYLCLFIGPSNAVCNDHSSMISKFKSCTEVRGLQSNLTLTEIKSKEAKLQSEVRAYKNCSLLLLTMCLCSFGPVLITGPYLFRSRKWKRNSINCGVVSSW
jgi:26S proteasome regulatory subunit, ATPase 3, interacting protein